MRAVLTRVKSASVVIDGKVNGKIGRGFLILLGVGPEDTERECKYLAEKALGLRIFTDENDKMNLGLADVGGEVLVVSQFTLYGKDLPGGRSTFTVRFEVTNVAELDAVRNKLLNIRDVVGSRRGQN